MIASSSRSTAFTILALLLVIQVSECQGRRRYYYNHHHGHHGGHHGQREDFSDKPEYYSVLGLPRGSPMKKVKRAFKKLAVKFHPDKAPADKKDEYNAKFEKISDAYSILSDKKKKNVYDAHGHAGLKRLEEQENQQNQQQAREEAWQARQNQDLFQGTDIEKLDTANLGRFYQRIGVWVVLFYRGNEQESQLWKEPLIQFHDRFYGIFTVAATNCEEHEDICEDFNALDTPALMVFSHNTEKEPERYTGPKNVGKLAGYSAYFLEDYVRVLTKDNIEDFMKSNWAKPKVVLLTNKKSTPPLLKVLSKEFKSSAAFAIIKNSAELVSLFGDLRAPTIFSIGATLEEKELYEGEFKKMSIVNFIRERVHVYKPPSKSTLKEVVKIDSVKDLARAKCSSSYKQLCFILFTNKNDEENLEYQLKDIATGFGEDPINFAVMRKELFDFKALEFRSARDQQEDLEGVKGILLKPAKKKIGLMRGNDPKQAIMTLLETVMSGSFRFKRIKNDIEDCIFERDEVDL